MDTTNLFLHWLLLCSMISLFAVMFIILAKFLLAIVNGKADWRDLFCDPQGRIASKKCWSHVAAGVYTFAVIKDSLDGEVNLWLLLSYMLVVGGFEVVMKLLSMLKPPSVETK